MHHRSIGTLSTALFALVVLAAPAMAAGGITDGWAHRSTSSPSTTASFAIADMQAGQPQQFGADGWAHVPDTIALAQGWEQTDGTGTVSEARVAAPAPSTPPTSSGIVDEVLLGTLLLLVGLGMGAFGAAVYTRRHAEGLS